MENNENSKSSRRNFLRNVGIGVGAVSVAGVARATLYDGNEARPNRAKWLSCLSPDGTLVEVDQDDIQPAKEIVAEVKGSCKDGTSEQEVHNGC